jgi:hypothetical protein
MIGADELLRFRLKYHHAPPVIHLIVGDGAVVDREMPCEIYISPSESPAGLDLRAIKNLVVVCYLRGLPTARAWDYLSAIIAADPALLVASYFESETDEFVLRWWRRDKGSVEQWIEE